MGLLRFLNGGVQLEPSNRCWLAEFSCVASWHTIDATNNILYLQEKPATGNSILRTLTLAHGVYDLDALAAEIEAKINVAGATTLGFLYVTRASTASSGPETGGSTSFKALRIAAAYPDKTFCLPSEAVIRQLWILPAILPRIRRTTSSNSQRGMKHARRICPVSSICADVIRFLSTRLVLGLAPQWACKVSSKFWRKFQLTSVTACQSTGQ